MKNWNTVLFLVPISVLIYISILLLGGIRVSAPIQIEKDEVLLTDNLDENSSGRQVAILQAGLKSIYLYTSTISGFYTYSTQEAVRSFQVKHFLTATGKVDLSTRIKFNELFGMKSADELLDAYGSAGNKWGVAKKVDGTRYGWSMKIENDLRMSTAMELFDALNVYRQRKGKAELLSSDTLTAYAQSRAEFLMKNGGVDDHVGFRQFSRNPQNRESLGFARLGENTSCGYRMTGTHMVEWVFAGDAPHDNNQLSERWSHVGIGIVEDCVSLVFGR